MSFADEMSAIVREAVREELAKALRGLAPSTGPDPLTVPEVAAEWRCSIRTVQRLIATKRLRAVRIGKSKPARLMVQRSALNAYLAESST